MTQPTRSIALQGVSNFRDLGGYRTEDGRTVRWRKLFRSDHLASLTPQDIAQLEALGVARAVDFRGAQERKALAYDWPGVQGHVLGIEPTVVQRALEWQAAGRTLTAADAVAMMEQTYVDFVDHNSDRFAALFRMLIEGPDTPLVFHCTAGKDRTGFAAALILRALGVPHDVVVQDYLLTNTLYQRPPGIASPAPQEVLEVLWRVQEAFLEAAFARVEEAHGGVERYLGEGLGLTGDHRVEIRERYLG